MVTMRRMVPVLFVGVLSCGGRGEPTAKRIAIGVSPADTLTQRESRGGKSSAG